MIKSFFLLLICLFATSRAHALEEVFLGEVGLSSEGLEKIIQLSLDNGDFLEEIISKRTFKLQQPSSKKKPHSIFKSLASALAQNAISLSSGKPDLSKTLTDIKKGLQNVTISSIDTRHSYVKSCKNFECEIKVYIYDLSVVFDVYSSNLKASNLSLNFSSLTANKRPFIDMDLFFKVIPEKNKSFKIEMQLPGEQKDAKFPLHSDAKVSLGIADHKDLGPSDFFKYSNYFYENQTYFNRFLGANSGIKRLFDTVKVNDAQSNCLLTCLFNIMSLPRPIDEHSILNLFTHNEESQVKGIFLALRSLIANNIKKVIQKQINRNVDRYAEKIAIGYHNVDLHGMLTNENLWKTKGWSNRKLFTHDFKINEHHLKADVWFAKADSILADIVGNSKLKKSYNYHDYEGLIAFREKLLYKCRKAQFADQSLCQNKENLNQIDAVISQIESNIIDRLRLKHKGYDFFKLEFEKRTLSKARDTDSAVIKANIFLTGIMNFKKQLDRTDFFVKMAASSNHSDLKKITQERAFIKKACRPYLGLLTNQADLNFDIDEEENDETLVSILNTHQKINQACIELRKDFTKAQLAVQINTKKKIANEYIRQPVIDLHYTFSDPNFLNVRISTKPQEYTSEDSSHSEQDLNQSLPQGALPSEIRIEDHAWHDNILLSYHLSIHSINIMIRDILEQNDYTIAFPKKSLKIIFKGPPSLALKEDGKFHIDSGAIKIKYHGFHLLGGGLQSKFTFTLKVSEDGKSLHLKPHIDFFLREPQRGKLVSLKKYFFKGLNKSIDLLKIKEYINGKAKQSKFFGGDGLKLVGEGSSLENISGLDDLQVGYKLNPSSNQELCIYFYKD